MGMSGAGGRLLGRGHCACRDPEAEVKLVFFNGGSLVCMVMRESLGSARNNIHSYQGIFRALTHGKAANTINSPICHCLKTPVDSNRLHWQLPWVLFGIQRARHHCSNRGTVFRGQSSILGNMPSHLGATVSALPIHSVFCIYYRASC